MGSIIIETATARCAFGVRSAVGLCSLVLLANVAAAQHAAELANLVFEPVPLASAKASPIDLNFRPASDDQAQSNSIRQYLAVIEPLRRAGSTDPELIEQLALLGVAYQGLDRHEEAIATFDEAISLTVDNGGRNNPEQIPLQEQKLPSYLALDDIKSVDATEELVYALKERSLSPGSRDMYIATINLADWNTTAYFRENYGVGIQALRRQRAVIDRAPRNLADASGDSSNPIFNGTIKDVFDQDIIDPRLKKIDRLYRNYQEAMSERGNAQLDIAVDVAKRIARLAHFTKQEMDFERANSSIDPNYEDSREQAARNSPRRMEESYDSGREALNYALTVLRSVEGVRPEAVAAALLDLGDWHLAYGKSQAAKDAYGEAYEVLQTAGFSSANIDIALATAMPIQIPIFATHLYSRISRGLQPGEQLDYKGYTDVSYSVDELGNASDIRILDHSTADASLIETALERHLNTVKFRPVLSDGELHRTERIEARYYYAY
jgi:tetratricopeptide (TPR) repeat protein